MPNPRLDRAALVDGRVVVLPFEDRRERENADSFGFLGFPLVFWTTGSYPTPEDIFLDMPELRLDFRPVRDLAEAVAMDLDNSRVFREVVPGFRATDGDFVLRGELTMSEYTRRTWPYGLTILAVIPWMLGAPTHTTWCELEVRLSLHRGLEDAALWEHTLHEEVSETHFQPLRAGAINAIVDGREAGIAFDDALARGMLKVVASLEEAQAKLR